MKFERLNPPSWFPDLVAFNEGVHAWVDPVWARRWVRWICWASAALFVLFAAMWIYFAAGLPSAQTLLPISRRFRQMSEAMTAIPSQTFAREHRVDLSYDEIPPLLVQSFTSAEDKDFFHHHGIDYTGLVKAVFNYTTHLGRGGRVPGGSTITQQVAKYLLKDSSYNVGRKAREAILAFRLEDTLSKQQILELYLNSIFLGRNAYGIQAASRAYFDKDVDELPFLRPPISRSSRRRRPTMILSAQLKKRSTGATTCCARCIATATSAKPNGIPPPKLHSEPSATEPMRNLLNRAAISWRRFGAS